MNPIRWIKNIFKKAVSIGGAALSSVGLVQWFTRDYANFAKEAYIQNFVAYRCIDIIAQSVSSVPWGVYKKVDEGREAISDHPLMRILHRANPSEGWSAFQLGVVSYLNIAGQSFIEKLAPESGPNKGIPLELRSHRPDQIKPVLTDEKELMGWALVVDGKVKKEWEIDPITGQSDLLQIKRFHPLSDIEGLSPIEPAAKSIDTSNEALTWNKNLLQNEARPGTMFIFNTALGDDQFKRLQRQLNQKVTGSENVGKNLIVEGDMKDAKPFGFSPTEMDFLKGNWDLVRQVCMTFGVPPQVLGVPGDSTFANFEQARLFLWETTVLFYLQLLKDEYNNWFFPGDDKIFIDYILDNVPALAPRRKEKWEMITKSDFLTIDEKREALGMEKYQPTGDPGGVLLVPANMVSLDMIGITEEEVDDSESDMDDIDVDIDNEETDKENDDQTGLELKVLSS